MYERFCIKDWNLERSKTQPESIPNSTKPSMLKPSTLVIDESVGIID